MVVAIDKLKRMAPAKGVEFYIGKVGHFMLQETELGRSTEFYTKVLAFKVSDGYPEPVEAIANSVPGQDARLPR